MSESGRPIIGQADRAVASKVANRKMNIGTQMNIGTVTAFPRVAVEEDCR